MKALSAILFALAMTIVIGASLFAIGGNALLNKNTVPITNAPGVTNVSAASSTTSNTAAVSTADQQKIAQLQQLVNQYQAREQQYQTELNQAVQRLNDANQQLTTANQTINSDNQTISSYQQLISQLQQAGVITITSDGHVYLGRNH